VLTGTTDTHDGTFSGPERTVLLASAPDGAGIKGAVLAGQTLLARGSDPRLLYGSDDMICKVAASLRDGKSLRLAKARRLAEALRRADVVGLLTASPATP
jgi:hypothetical protein